MIQLPFLGAGRSPAIPLPNFFLMVRSIIKKNCRQLRVIQIEVF